MSIVTSTADSELIALAESSMALIVGLQDSSGAYPASPTFSAYRGYSWFRDGAFIADGVSSWGSGGVASASRFHDWCARVLVSRESHIASIVSAASSGAPVADRDMLPTRFTYDGREGDDDWWDFQLDGYGTWLWAVVEHARRHELPLDQWRVAMGLAVDYLVSSWQRPCFDWWEEHSEAVHVSTLGCISAGLSSAIDSGVLSAEKQRSATLAVAAIDTLVQHQGMADGHLVKWLGSTAVDASLISLVYPLNVYPAHTPVGKATIEAVDGELCVDGGVHRFLDDTFFGGGQWPLLSCMLGLAYSAAGDRERAAALLRWAASTATPDGLLPEQVGNHLLDPSREREWIERWGPVATPLLWSHAMFIRLAAELGLKGTR